MSRIRPLATTALVLALVSQTTGCATWRVIPNPSPEALAKGEPGRYRLGLDDGRTVVVARLQRLGDSLVVPIDLAARDPGPGRLAFAIQDVQKVEARDGMSTGLAVLLGITGISLMIVLFMDTGSSFGSGDLWTN